MRYRQRCDINFTVRTTTTTTTTRAFSSRRTHGCTFVTAVEEAIVSAGSTDCGSGVEGLGFLAQGIREFDSGERPSS